MINSNVKIISGKNAGKTVKIIGDLRSQNAWRVQDGDDIFQVSYRFIGPIKSKGEPVDVELQEAILKYEMKDVAITSSRPGVIIFDSAAGTDLAIQSNGKSTRCTLVYRDDKDNIVLNCVYQGHYATVLPAAVYEIDRSLPCSF